MVTTEDLMVLKNQLLAKASEAVRAGNVPALSAISAKAAECERLIAEAQDLDERFSSLSSYLHTSAERLALHDGPPPLSTARPRFAKRDGAEMRAQWIADMKAKGVQLQGYGKRYTTAFGVTVGLAPANELDGHPNKWFLGMADEPTDVIVLLCRSRSGKVYDLVLPVPVLGRCWALLSRSGSQVKFNLRKDGTVFLLLVPGNEPFDVTQYLSHYEPLVISRPQQVNSVLTTNSSLAREPSRTTFGRKNTACQACMR